MLLKKIFISFSSFSALILLSSWALPTSSLSRGHVAPYYAPPPQPIEPVRIEQPAREDYRLAHKKNRLAYYTDRDGYIWFDDEDNRYTFFLSNFYPCSVRIWNMKFPSAEAAHQAAKFLHKPALAARFTQLDAEEALKLGQRHSYEQRADWYKIREDVMLDILRAKFNQHPDLTQRLLATGDAYLVEHTDRDSYWADGGDGKGKNILGKLLMRLREEKGGVGVVSKPSKYRKFASE